ncbi:hypothetical protein DCC62_26415 [candidate division KSB1 bacterium]|nr:MAG: hypothetical protein DCC62_26415 [candidate division KSB1 bacterium]
MNLSHFLDDSLTIFGTQSLQQEIYLWENRREQSVRYRLTAVRERNNQYLDEGLRRTQMQHELRLTWALSPKVTSQTELKLNREDRIFDSAGRNDRLVRSRQAEVELSYRPRPALEVANRLGAAFDRDLHETFDRPSLRAQALFLRPRVAYALRGRGRLQGEIEWVSVSAEPAGQVLPYELAKGNREGTTWSLGGISREQQREFFRHLSRPPRTGPPADLASRQGGDARVFLIGYCLFFCFTHDHYII